MYHRRLKKELAIEQNLGKKNLLVSGCSFTSNVEIDSIDNLVIQCPVLVFQTV
jgi:hypothetical protein